MTVLAAIIRSGALAVMAGTAVGLCHLFPNAATSPETGMILKLPERRSGYLTYEVPVSKEEKKWLPGDTQILKRAYVPSDVFTQEEMHLRVERATLILSGSDQRSLHRPEVCLEAQGWTIEKRVPVTLEVAGEKLEVLDLFMVRSDQQPDGELKKSRGHYVYWWIGKKRSTPWVFWRSLYSFTDNAFRNRNSRWGYPSVQVLVDPAREPAAGEKDAQERAYRFIREYAPMFQKSLGAGEDQDAG
ncbi:MAG: exosortase-associated EpsI family protein [Akkermansiaceae bacterium]|nr:exosortase-associated EpsI family protein [Akkermansiaceae bacterium]